MEIDNYTMAVILLCVAILIGLIVAWLSEKWKEKHYRTRDYWKEFKRSGL